MNALHCSCFTVHEEDYIVCYCFQVKSNDDLLAAMAGGNHASSSNVTKTKRTASIGTSASTLDSKQKTTSGKPKMFCLDITSLLHYYI